MVASCSGSPRVALRDAASSSTGGSYGSRASGGAGVAGTRSTTIDAGMRGDAGVRIDSGASVGGMGGHAGSAGSSAGGRGANAGAGAGGRDARDAGASQVTSGWNLVAIDTAKRTYLAYVEVPVSGSWAPDQDGWPKLAQWENQTAYSALRFQAFTAGSVLSPAQIITLLPSAARRARSITITDPPYSAAVAPADAGPAIQMALDAAARIATPSDPVEVLVPPGTFNHSTALNVGADVRLRRFPEDSGGILHATDPLHGAVHLAGDRSAALFLVMTSDASARDTGSDSAGVFVGSTSAQTKFVADTLVIGCEVSGSASAHFFASGEDGGLWAFNYAHDGYADTFHHTGGSRFCQLVGNRAQTSASRGDDFYAFVGYQSDGDVVHHSSCIANWGRDGHARGLAALGAGFISFEHNDIDRTQWAGVYLAQENSYSTYGTFDVFVSGNRIAHANLNGSHDGLLAYADTPSASNPAASFGDVSNQIRRLTITDNSFTDTAAGLGNGFGIEIRASVDSGEVTDNSLSGNQTPQLVLNGTNFSSSGNQIMP